MKRLLFIAAMLGLTAGMMFFGIWPINAPAYPVRGVDVSHYQDEIDWEALASQGLSFAFIKATEGSTSIGPYRTIQRHIRRRLFRQSFAGKRRRLMIAL